MVARAVVYIALVSAAVLAGIGVYGITASRNLIRQMIALEVLFNAVLVVVVIALSSIPELATLLSIVLITVVSGEIIVVVAIIASLYRSTRSFDSASIEEEEV